MKTLEWTYPPRARCVPWPIYRGGWPGCHRWVAVLVINMQGPGVAPALAPTLAPTLAPAAAAQRENYWHFSACHIAVILIRRTFTAPVLHSLVARLKLLIFKSKEKSCKQTFGKFEVLQ